MTGAQPRERLLAAAIDHVVGHGLGDLSLRELAAHIGTSHRMLIYHFGSKEGLLVEVVKSVEAAQRSFFAESASNPGLSFAEGTRTFWRHIADPALAPHERLFFEVYAQALLGRPGTVALLDGIIDSWVEPVTAYATARGEPEASARADARLGVAVIRGLLLDLLATGDRPGVDAALERYIFHTDAGRASEGHSIGDSAAPRDARRRSRASSA
jgi:AcrR family transcriptional regulator